MVSFVNVLFISLVAGFQISRNSQASSQVSHQSSGFASQVGGFSSIASTSHEYFQRSFSVGSRSLNVNFAEFPQFAKLNVQQVNAFSSILESGFQAKQIDFNRFQSFCSSVQIDFSSILGQLFSIFRKVHLLNNEIKFDFKTWYANQLKQQNIIQLIQQNQKIEQAKKQLAAKQIQSILAQFYQFKTESVKAITLEAYLQKIKIESLGCYANDFLTIFQSLYKETESCYTIIPQAHVIYLPVKEPELILVGYSKPEASLIVQKNSFYGYFSKKVLSVNFSSQQEQRAFYVDIESNFKSCGFCIQQSKYLINKAVSFSHRFSSKVSIYEKLLSVASQEFSFENKSKLSSEESIKLAVGSDIDFDTLSKTNYESPTSINSGSKKEKDAAAQGGKDKDAPNEGIKDKNGLTEGEKEKNVSTKEERTKPEVDSKKPEADPRKPEDEHLKPQEEPVKPQEEPAKPKKEPVKPQEEPVKPKEEPVKPQEEPVKPEEEPVKPEEEPVNPEEEPVKPEEEPVKPEEEPVNPEEEPVKPEEKPVKPEEKPVKPEEEPVKPQEEPVKPKEEPVKPQEKPVKPEEEPVKPEEEPVKPEEEPVKPEEEPVKPEEEPVKPEEEPVKPEEEPVKPEEEPVKPEEEPVNPEEEPVNPEEEPVNPEEEPVNPEEEPVNPEEEPVKPEEEPVEDPKTRIIHKCNEVTSKYHDNSYHLVLKDGHDWDVPSKSYNLYKVGECTYWI